MDDPEWAGFLRERSPRIEMPKPKAPRRTRGPLAALLLVLATLYGMCRIPNWDGADPRGLTAQERADALRSPLPSEEKRRALVSTIHQEIRERIGILRAIAAEDSPAGEDARRAIANSRAALGD